MPDWTIVTERPGPTEPGRRATDSSRWWLAGTAFLLACVLPSLFFLWVGFSDDPTASASASEAVAWLIGIEVAIGAALGALTWAVSGAQNGRTRGALQTVVLLAAIGSGLVTGLLGGMLVAMARHPTWDDA